MSLKRHLIDDEKWRLIKRIEGEQTQVRKPKRSQESCEEFGIGLKIRVIYADNQIKVEDVQQQI